MPAMLAPSLAAALPQDRRARLAELYDAHGERTYRLALRYGRGDRGFAQDVAQDVFVDLIERLDGGAQIDNVGGWLYRATVHRALNLLRRERFLQLAPVRWVLGMQAPAPREPDSIVVERAELRALLADVDRLPDRQRVIVCMRHFDGTPQLEIAAIRCLSPGYVSKLLTRAEAQLARARDSEAKAAP